MKTLEITTETRKDSEQSMQMFKRIQQWSKENPSKSHWTEKEIRSRLLQERQELRLSKKLNDLYKKELRGQPVHGDIQSTKESLRLLREHMRLKHETR